MDNFKIPNIYQLQIIQLHSEVESWVNSFMQVVFSRKTILTPL